MRPKAECVTVDQYMNFLENPHSHDLTVTHLNQIIAMHGFKKLHKRPKKDLVEALNMMDLDFVSPFRSTLKDNISASAALTRDDVINDLDALQWAECSLQSIQTVSSVQDTTTFSGKVVKQRTGKRKTRKRRSLTALSSSAFTAIPSTNSSSRCWSQGLFDVDSMDSIVSFEGVA